MITTLLRAPALLALALFAVAVRADTKRPPAPEPVDFSAEVRPILSRCFACHGADEAARKGKLRLDLREEALKERKDGRVPVKPGDPEGSELIRRITSQDPDDLMPPAKGGPPLKEAEVELFRRWIREGANYTPHWAFIKPQRPTLPKVSRSAWCRNGIDYFIMARLDRAGLAPSTEADRYTLGRRVSLDLTGLPPTREEIARFVSDSRPDAYERMVDRLLDSPHFGERWARMWLDLARYADSAGYGSDPLRPNIWPYRDWVINAFNRNLPYDRFTLEQIAGDLVPNATRDQLVATAFHRNTMTNTEGGTDDEEWRVAAVKDRANVTAQVWMGLTMGCATCHTHKFDPITQRDYYSFYAYFNQTEDNDQPDERPTMPFYSPEEESRRSDLRAQSTTLEAEFQRHTPEFESELAAWTEAAARPVEWTPLIPVEAKSGRTNGATLRVLADGSVLAEGENPARDGYVVKVQTEARGLTAFRIEAIADDSLPKRGPGRSPANGNFVLTDFRARVLEGKPEPVSGRFVRIELPGKSRILSLAEVQVFAAGANRAAGAAATQSSTDYDGAPARAIDGNTNGEYYAANSVTHTRQEDDPWWEVDLGAEQVVDELAIWNRIDGGTAERLAGARVQVLDAGRRTRWETVLGDPPKVSATLSLNGERPIPLRNASADLAQGDMTAEKAVDADPKRSGWAGGGGGGGRNLVVETGEAIPGAGGTTLTFTITQEQGEQQTLGRFRLYATAQPAPVRMYPTGIQEILAQQPASRSEDQRRQLAEYFRPFSTSKAAVTRQIADLRKQLDGVRGTALPVMREVAAGQRRQSRLLNKGNFLDPGEAVTEAVPAAFHPLPEGAPPSRLGLAAWLTAPDNPLTARVAVNRFWAQLLGQGLVETEEDFGTQGTLPTHRELLDWLAVSFETSAKDQQLRRRDNSASLTPELGWDVKALLKLIVTSATYRQSSVMTPASVERDPHNHLYSRASRRRLEAETVRDQALALSGLLSRKVGGPSVYPIQPDGLWRAAFNGERTWATSLGEDRYRRGLYTFWRRTIPYPSMATFDAPSRETCTVRRLHTNTPLQAFVTLNDPVFLEAAEALARHLQREGGRTDAERIRWGLELVLARPADEEQVRTLLSLLDAERATYAGRDADAIKLSTEPLGPLPVGSSPAEAAAWTTVANVLLNLDGVLSKG